MNIQIVLFNGFDELDGLGPFEVLRMAADAKPDFQTQLVALDGPAEITGANGLRLHVPARLAQPPPDLVIVPGGGWIDNTPTGARAEIQRGDLPAMLARLHQDGTIPASVCTGALVLAAGLLKGRPAATNHGALDDLRAAGAEVINARVVDDGDIITAGGITSGLDLALWIIERFAGPPAARSVEVRLEYERRGTVWRRSA